MYPSWHRICWYYFIFDKSVSICLSGLWIKKIEKNVNHNFPDFKAMVSNVLFCPNNNLKLKDIQLIWHVTKQQVLLSEKLELEFVLSAFLCTSVLFFVMESYYTCITIHKCSEYFTTANALSHFKGFTPKWPWWWHRELLWNCFFFEWRYHALYIVCMPNWRVIFDY